MQIIVILFSTFHSLILSNFVYFIQTLARADSKGVELIIKEEGFCIIAGNEKLEKLQNCIRLIVKMYHNFRKYVYSQFLPWGRHIRPRDTPVNKMDRC